MIPSTSPLPPSDSAPHKSQRDWIWTSKYLGGFRRARFSWPRGLPLLTSRLCPTVRDKCRLRQGWPSTLRCRGVYPLTPFSVFQQLGLLVSRLRGNNGLVLLHDRQHRVLRPNST